jgi:hypothetical protein
MILFSDTVDPSQFDPTPLYLATANSIADSTGLQRANTGDRRIEIRSARKR